MLFSRRNKFCVEGIILPVIERCRILKDTNFENFIDGGVISPGNGAPIGGFKLTAEGGWFAARPSGTEDIYKIYAESFRGADHLRRILGEGQAIVSDALGASPDKDRTSPVLSADSKRRQGGVAQRGRYQRPYISCFAKRALCAPANIQQSVHVAALKISR